MSHISMKHCDQNQDTGPQHSLQWDTVCAYSPLAARMLLDLEQLQWAPVRVSVGNLVAGREAHGE